MSNTLKIIAALSIWKSDVDISSIDGGITNQNYIVTDRKQKFFVRIGEDIPEHGIKRFNELAASRAAHAAGLSPEVVHAQPGIMVLQYIDAAPLSEEDVRQDKILPEIIELVKRCHRDIPGALRGPALVFWVFQVLRDYAHTLQEGKSDWLKEAQKLMAICKTLEQQIGEIELVFGHNDLLSANFLDSGDRLWLIDWDYAGFNSPLFDLGGLASNNQFSAEMEANLLERYFGHKPDKRLMKKYSAMKCASLVREVMWSMVSEAHSKIEFDYAAYTNHNLIKLYQAWETHQQKFGLL